MAKLKGKKIMGKRPAKVSLVKHSNKRYSKLLKRGKIKKNDKRLNMGAPVELMSRHTWKGDKAAVPIEDLPVSDEEDVDVEDMLEGEDDHIDAMKENLINLTFDSEDSKVVSTGRKRKKILDKNDDDCHSFEKQPRQFDSYKEAKEMRSVLPIKGKYGIIPQYVEIQDNPGGLYFENKEADKLEENGVHSTDLSQISERKPASDYRGFDLEERKRKIMFDYKMRIAYLANNIIGSPQTNMQSLKELREMLDDEEPIGFVYRQKLVMVSLLEVFKDIIPGYRLRSTGDEEKEQRLKKDTRELLVHEEALLRHYKGYLQKLEAETRAISRKKNRIERLGDKSAEKLGEVAIKCLCDLLITHPHFNFRNNIIVTLVPFTTSLNENVSNMCCNALKVLYRQDKVGDVALEAVKQTTKLIKDRSYNVLPKVLGTFLFLRIKEAKFSDEEKAKKMSHKEKQMKMSRREIKKNKRMEKLEKEMLETAAEESKQKKISYQTEVIKQVFLTYFRILKKAPKSTLLSSVLEGLAKYAHLINVEFFDDLITVLHRLVDSGTLDYRQCLHCVLTVFTILSGQGEALNIDPYRFYTHLYRNLLDLHVGMSHDDLPIAIQCLDLMINQRKKKVSYHRVLAFTKRLTTLALQLNHNGAIAVLALVRTFMQNHKRVDILLDTDTSQGSGTFLPELDEPEYCNAATTALWELHLMRSHYHPAVQKFAAHLAIGAPIMGDGQLSQDLSRKTPEDLYEEFLTGDADFNPVMDNTALTKISKAKIKTKQRHWVPVFSKSYQEMTDIMEGIDLSRSFYCSK